MYEDKDENRNYEDNEQKLIEARMENMRKEYRKQEYVAVVIINVVFAIFSYFFYSSVRKISTIKIYENVPVAAIGWFLYGGCLCLALRHEKIEDQGRNRTILKAVIFGVFVAIAKMGLDYVTDWIGVGRFREIFIASGVENALFGLLITVILFAVFVRGKVRWSVQSANLIAGIVGLLMLYTMGVNILGVSYDEAEMISLNVGAYALFMVLLWWLLNTLYEQKESEKDKSSRRINVGIALGQLVLLGILISWLNEQEISPPVIFTYPYQVSIENGLAIVKAYLSEESEVEIPERIWWAKEIFIDREAYSNLGTDLTVHNIPEGVSVGKLYHKESQCYFMIRGSEAYIDDYVGDEKRVEIPEEVWGRKVTGISVGCFYESSVEEVIIPETVKYIGAYAFSKSGIEEIVFSNTVDEISEYAFSYSALKEVSGLDNVKNRGNDPFRGTPWEESFEGDFFCIGEELHLYCGEDEEVVIPETVKEIKGAFAIEKDYLYPIKVKKVFVPDSVVAISGHSFWNQNNVEVYIPETVVSIGKGSETTTSIFNWSVGKGTIVTTSGSPAEAYAKKEKIPCRIITKEEMQQEMEVAKKRQTDK